MTSASYSSTEKHAGDAGLLVLAHPKPVDVQARARLLDERRLGAQSGEVADAGRVDDVGVRIRVLGQLDLGPRDAQEAQRLVRREGPRLGRIDDVVGHRSDGRRLRRLGSQGAEREDRGHRSSLPERTRRLGGAPVTRLRHPGREPFAQVRHASPTVEVHHTGVIP